MNNITTGAISFIRFRMALIAVLGAPAAVYSAPWDFGVNIDLGAIYTDNIFLDQAGQEEGDLVYTIAPEFYLTSDGDRIDADFRYRPEAYFYQSNTDANAVFHVLDATMTGALVREKFFLFLSASNFQSIVTPEGQFPTNNVPISNNRVDSRILEVRPYWEQRLGSMDLLLELAYIDIRFDDPQFQNNTIRRGLFELNSIDRQQGFAWSTGYRNVISDYEDSAPWEFQRAELDIGYWITGNARVFVVGGAESDIDNLLESNLDAEFWEVGMQYRPSDRFNLEFAAGDRSYGRSFRANFEYRLRRGDTSLDYSETPATGAQLPLGYRPVEDTDNLGNILDEPGRSDRFVRKRLNWTTDIELLRSALTVRVFGERREQRVSADGMPLDEEQFAGVAIRWGWNMGVNTAVGIGVDVSRRDDSVREDDLRRLQIDLTYRLSERLSLLGVIMRSSQEGRESSEFDYVENQFRLLLRTEL